MGKNCIDFFDTYQEYKIENFKSELEQYIIAINAIKLFGLDDDFYMMYKNGKDFSVGIGRYIYLAIYPRKILIKKSNYEECYFTKNLSKDINNIFEKINLNVRSYGVITFDYAKNTFLNNVDENEKIMEIFIPNIDIQIKEKSINVKYIKNIKELESKLENCLKIKPDENYIDKKIDVDSIKCKDSLYYEKIVSKAIEEINQNQYDKVILSRKINLDARVCMFESYIKGIEENNPARSYCLKVDDLEIMGFSPETVIEVDKNRTVKTFPLAGTRAFSANAELNRKLKQDLMGDAKEIAEHSVSVKLAFEELEKVCEKESICVYRFLEILERGSVQHLASKLRGKIKKEFNEWDALTALFPAVTASGIPKKESIAAIDRLEKDKRGVYSGGIFTYDKDGALDVALVLRTVFQNKFQTWVRAGAGIVKLSSPQRELEETKEKLDSIVRHLVYENED